jgi:hypothetical protein
MTTTNKFARDTRKALVTAIQEILQCPVKYLGMPTAAYELNDGEYHVAKDGTLTGPENPQLLEALLARGFAPEAEIAADPAEKAPETAEIAENPAPEADSAQKTAEIAETQAEIAEKPAPQAETDHVTIEYPRTGFTPEKLDNLCKLVAAKEELIKLAIGADELPIQADEEKISFPWLQTTDPEMVDALATFICALCKTALTKKRVTATPQPTGINDRYRFRCFMLHIGMIGPEYATARTRLMRDLSGNSGWLVPPEKAPEVLASESIV